MDFKLVENVKSIVSVLVSVLVVLVSWHQGRIWWFLGFGAFVSTLFPLVLIFIDPERRPGERVLSLVGRRVAAAGAQQGDDSLNSLSEDELRDVAVTVLLVQWVTGLILWPGRSVLFVLQRLRGER